MSRVQIELFAPSDLLAMDVQEKHAYLVPFILSQNLTTAYHMVSPWSWTVWSCVGIPLGAAGVVDDTGYTWAFLSKHIKRHMVAVHRGVDKGLRAYCTFRGKPAYATIDTEHPEAVRWATALGFFPSPCEEDERRWVFNKGLDA